MLALIDPRLTLEDLQAMPDDGRRHEILEGDLFVSPSPNRRHQRIVSNLDVLLRRLEHLGYGQGFVAPFDVVLSTHTVVEPDALFVVANRLEIVTERFVDGPPDLAVEVLSDSTRAVDRGEKLKLYARYAVQEYWVVDAAADTVSVYRLSRGSYPIAPEVVTKGEIAASSVFGGATIHAGEILMP